MNLLLDTHALLWWLDDDPGLSDKARNAIAEGRNVVFVSAASRRPTMATAAMSWNGNPPRLWVRP
jgi:hypothetical protein